MRSRTIVRVLQASAALGGGIVAIALITAPIFAQAPAARRAASPATWGRGPFQPTEANPFFATADGCAYCHSASDDSSALRSATGDDVSPHGLWQASVMANSMRDPYFVAQLSREMNARPEEAASIEALCLKCHAPTLHHSAQIRDAEPPFLSLAMKSALGSDGVTCTVCHQAQPDNLGEPAGFNGDLVITDERRIFGPYEDPETGPMRAHTAFTPTHGAHIRDAGLCASCHTLTVDNDGVEFLEQSAYMEWLNSDFSDQPQPTANTRTCQQCHMPSQGSMRLARTPAGTDFNIAIRENLRAHSFVGGNAFLLEMINRHRDEFLSPAPAEAFERQIRATRANLAYDSARVEFENARVDGGQLLFDVRVENLTGHKLPTGYPSRRMWLHVRVRDRGALLFESGASDDAGRLAHVDDAMRLPHHEIITMPEQVQVWERVAHNAAGEPTTMLTQMTGDLKDNRILPPGWSAEGPYAQKTAPVGVGNDENFVAGSDVITYRIDLPEPSPQSVIIVADLRYQSIPPAWASPFRGSDDALADRFVRMYDAVPTRSERMAFRTLRVPIGAGRP